jgi:hypothetical protein
MHVLLNKNVGATDYWRFPWLRFKGGYSVTWRPPIFQAALLRKQPDLKFPFIQTPDKPGPEVYYPLEEAPGISRQFLAVRNVDDALAFANDYGLMGLDAVPRYSGHRAELDQNGENLNDWFLEATELGQAYEVWDLIAGDVGGLREIVVGTAQGMPVIWPKTGRRGRSFRTPHWVQPAPGLKPEEVLALAKGFIAERYNRKMMQMASPMLLLDAKGAFHSYNRPSSLLGALWLEFGEIASGSRKQVLCESCGQWMDVTDNRSHKRKHDRCVLREKMARLRQKQRDGRAETNTP